MLGDGEVLKGAAQIRKKSKKCNKDNNSSSSSRRFSDEQIKSLESLFKMENKLEPRKKLEMARELGLHPRQVAIWFQNRRARWKSKQVEQDYTTLKADYDTLNHRFQSLKNEKHHLLQQLRNLCNQLKEAPHEGSINCKLDMESGSENGDMITNLELNGSRPPPLEQDTTAIYNNYSDEEDDPIKQSTDDDINVGLQQKLQELADDDDDENIIMNTEVEEEEAHETVTNFDDLGSLFDHYSCSSNWWDV